MIEGHKAPGHFTDSYRFGEPAEAISQGMPFTVSGPPLTGNSSLSNQASMSHKPGTENSASLRNACPLLDKPLQREQLNFLSKECAGDKRGKDCEHGKTDQTGRLRASRFKELDPFTVQTQEHETGRQTMESNMFGTEERMETLTSDNRPSSNRGGLSPSVSNQAAGALSDQTIDILVREGKCLDVDNLSIGSSIIALEELVSRLVWLKGVLQLGLKGWSQERHKRKWTLCEIEAPPCGSFEQDGKSASLEQGSEKPLLKDTVGSPLEVADQEVCFLASSSGQSSLA